MCRDGDGQSPAVREVGHGTCTLPHSLILLTGVYAAQYPGNFKYSFNNLFFFLFFFLYRENGGIFEFSHCGAC